MGSTAKGRERAARERNGLDSASALARGPSVVFGDTSPSQMERIKTGCQAASTSTTSASSSAFTCSTASPVIAAPSRVSSRTPFTSTAPRATTR